MTAQESMTGRIFGGRYEIKGRIGIGGMAEVYRAQDNVLGRTVAVKVMLPQYAADPDFTQRFRQEAAAAANLQSPYIVNVYDWGQDSGTYYIVMEFVRGSDLKTAIQQRGVINQRKVAEIGAQVCQALTVAHNQDIIHRDIKPQNIMVQPDGNVKVMDFGIARAKNSVKQQTSSVLGTAHYISPEQAQGKELTAASDIYSLGVVLYEATTGQLPFDAPDAVAVAMMQVQNTPVPPTQINPDIDPALEDIILCAMEKDPRNRFATANDMRLALNDYLAGRTVALNYANYDTYENYDNYDTYGEADTQYLGQMPRTTPVVPINSTQVMPGLGKNGNQGSPVQQFRGEPEKTSSKKGIFIAIGVAAVIALIAIIGFTIFAGAGGAKKAVPAVTGMTLEQATEAIEADGFALGTVTPEYNANVEEGHVIKQDPSGQSQQPEGTKINLTVSQGSEQVIVPDLTNKTVEEARAEASRIGFTLTAAPGEYSNDIERNKIIKTDPAANSSIKKGSSVSYVLSLGPDTITIPSLYNLTLAEAQSLAEQQGFTLQAGESEYSTSVPANHILHQSPEANTTAQRGSVVTYGMSLGPEPEVTVPNVRNYTRDEAKSTLESAGFTVEIETQNSSTVAAGLVISQTPSGGTSAQRRSTVTIVVSLGPGSGGSSGNAGNGLNGIFGH